ncbi:nucleotide-diphospho-sugar transferase [Hymenobacter cellulosivorans]|uniref:Nucleotide-diphospho-sugar transferase n=1 Tax=Hymenobacter cellulosivorans TaxID=2932249 RepID=A0ABY4F3K0_9BACT|nr:nucleotide-diphospho-sugar transferase [Hymenobacter cellulosivorans]UOQ50806.1 nucleotide-diphospho-sugar transferase [Hymenobacter cellulosivorans]
MSPSDSASGLSTPVLFIIFNRPESTRQVLLAIRAARPARLYVAADGPRPGRPAEAALCAQVRALVTDHIDWPCEVYTRFRETNLGCGLNPAEAIDWFFEREPEGIILEDDCLPSPHFFQFCQELLVRYRLDARVMHIGGCNFSREALRPQDPAADSYYFSGQVQSWGWASWRRAWQHFDFKLQLLPELRRRRLLGSLYPSLLERQYWLPRFQAIYKARQAPSIWDYQWHFAVAANSGLTILPAVNLVCNIGFGQDATHTTAADEQFARPAAEQFAFPLRHPPAVLRDLRRDQQYFREFLSGRVAAKTRRLLQRVPRWFREQGTVPLDPPYAPEPEEAATHTAPAAPLTYS